MSLENQLKSASIAYPKKFVKYDESFKNNIRVFHSNSFGQKSS